MGEALLRHTEEKLSKRGWSKGAIAVIGAIIASLLAFWCGSCTAMPEMTLDMPSYGNVHFPPKERVK